MRLKAALVGVGAIAQTNFEALAREHERVEVVAAVDPKPERLQAFCSANSIPRWYIETQEMLNAEKPQLVVIASPSDTHAELNIRCLEAGAWVLCEKPICASLAEMDAIEAAEYRTGNYCSVISQRRFSSAARQVRQLIKAGELGAPLTALVQTTWYRPMSYYSQSWHGTWKGEGGGAAVTLGIHLIDLLLWLYGDWRQVQAMIATLDRTIEAENVSSASVRFENGALASILTSAVSPREESYLRLDFQKATVEVRHLYSFSNRDWIFSIPNESTDAPHLERWRRIETEIPPDHHAQLRDLLDCYESGERPMMSGAEPRRTLEFMASFYKSAFTGQVVERGTITPSDAFYHTMNGGLYHV
ncbi:MAG: Gfo/Idh/MocA family oxidoreductase [bacterium]|nr:Gfo/Idh/MocA family oxidoreductase [bacterium]